MTTNMNIYGLKRQKIYIIMKRVLVFRIGLTFLIIVVYITVNMLAV
jgi:hypothetical protein